MEPTAFVLASLALLATPGPTNTLLATSGAAVGARRSLRLLPAELSGYLLAILLLRSVVGPVVASPPALGHALRLLVVLYLLYLAARLWRDGGRVRDDGGAVTFPHVFVTTLLNPKAIIFAFTLLPVDLDLVALAPWVGALALQIFAVGSIWVGAGASLRRGFGAGVPYRIIYRTGALALVILAGAIGAHAFQVA